jgi:hypothetical protein
MNEKYSIMKTGTAIHLIFFVLLIGSGCTDDLEYIPIDQLTTNQIVDDPALLETATVGNYSYIKAGPDGDFTQRMRHRLIEYQSDDLIMMRWSSNHLSYTLTYQPVVNHILATDFWNAAYYAIFAINTVVEAIPDDASAELLNLKGENLWMRAHWMFDLVRIFARPYSHDSPETNLGVMIRDNTDVYALPGRSTVKECYEFIEQDLLKAAELMTIPKSNKYASKEVAWATLARLYLYMEQNDKALEYANKVIGSGRYTLLDTQTLPTYNTLTPEQNSETIFAVKLMSSENQGRNSIGSMFHRDGGWGELMTSSSLMDLLWKNPNDQRIKFIDPHFKLDADGNKIPDSTNIYYGYEMYDRMGVTSYYSLKFTYENGEAMLHSPVFFRLAEMYLIAAEACAKLGQDQLALDNAGLSGDQLFTLSDLKGYETVLDVVLDEKRLELWLEGHRAQDVFRNKRTMDRSYMAWQGWSGPSYIPYTSNRIVHFIPEDEMTRNPNLVQNPPLEPLESLPQSLPGK